MQTATATSKPEYLGLLNAISLAESQAGVYLRAWANATTNEELACTLRLVAAREISHGEVFCRRISELGYTLRQKADPKADERLLKYANPRINDVDKINPDIERKGDPFGEIERKLADGCYDPMTANLLTWYIAEERDTGRRLRECYACLRTAEKEAPAAKTNGRSNGHATNGAADSAMGPSSDAQAIMACMSQGFSRLEKSLEKFARAAR